MFHFDTLVEKNKNYTHTPSAFCRLLLLRDFFYTEKNIILLVENEKNIQNYIKISDYLNSQKILNKCLIKLDNFSQIVGIVYNRKGLYISTPDIFYQEKLDRVDSEKSFLKIELGKEMELSKITKKLNELGYVFKEYEENGSFRVSGDILSFSDMSGEAYKISFWGNMVEEIICSSSTEKRKSLFIGKNEKISFEEKKHFDTNLFEKLNHEESLMILDGLDFLGVYDLLIGNLKNYINFTEFSQNQKNEENLGYHDVFIENIDELKKLLEQKEIKEKYIFTKNKNTFQNFLEFNNISGVQIYENPCNNLKSFGSSKSICICDDNLSRIFIKKRGKRKITKDMDLLLQIKPGDYIVHIDHGIGVFCDMVEKEIEGMKKEYIELEYQNNDKLFVPITEVGRISKYVGVENPKLTPLSTKAWENKLKKVSEDVEKIAKELLEIYAKRKIHRGYAFHSFPKEEGMFQKSFEFSYTKDQTHTIQEIFTDMESNTPMDRLLCGDVGFGKTEVAFNAIYKSIINGKQAVLISPLVVLAYEHFEKAKERFKNFPFNIEVLTRFESEKKTKEIQHKLKTGKIDIIIGTHKLLNPDVMFKDLGLLIVDEEHKFGVKDKEKIKNFKGNVDILSLSATPIPRSLNMALNGIKSISMLTTPPHGRQAITTTASNFSDQVIFDAGKREFERNGQLFFIHNRVETIQHMEGYLTKIFPKKKIIVTHGQLPGDTLEKRIIDFKHKKYDILLSTTVIENGIDFSNVNTIIINEAAHFGISQIHQLRGRVGRSEKQGYCYLLFKKDTMKQDASTRLKTIVDYSHLGAGFELAIKDLEIRGGGDILGIRQSGQSVEVGVNLFLQMLENKIEELRSSSVEHKNPSQPPLVMGGVQTYTKIDLNIPIFIDNSFFSSELDKINFYREIESLESIEDLQSFITDFKETQVNASPLTRLPKGAQNFFQLLRLKIIASQYYIQSIKKIGLNYQIDFQSLSGDKKEIENLKNFLDLDKEVHFRVISPTRIRSEVKKFTNDESFLEYMLLTLLGKVRNKKIKRKA